MGDGCSFALNYQKMMSIVIQWVLVSFCKVLHSSPPSSAGLSAGPALTGKEWDKCMMVLILSAGSCNCSCLSCCSYTVVILQRCFSDWPHPNMRTLLCILYRVLSQWIDWPQSVVYWLWLYCKAIAVKDQSPWDDLLLWRWMSWSWEHCFSTVFVTCFKDGILSLFPKYFRFL